MATKYLFARTINCPIGLKSCHRWPTPGLCPGRSVGESPCRSCALRHALDRLQPLEQLRIVKRVAEKFSRDPRKEAVRGWRKHLEFCFEIRVASIGDGPSIVAE